jgi:hypothetical protein
LINDQSQQALAKKGEKKYIRHYNRRNENGGKAVIFVPGIDESIFDLLGLLFICCRKNGK